MIFIFSLDFDAVNRFFGNILFAAVLILDSSMSHSRSKISCEKGSFSALLPLFEEVFLLLHADFNISSVLFAKAIQSSSIIFSASMQIFLLILIFFFKI